MNPNKRLLSLDVLRGITVAGMILVNNTGKCGYNFAAFAHAKWDGFSPADLVFPMFMFLMGISTYISLCKYNFQCRPAIAKIIKRSLLLIFIGLVMEWFITSIDSGNYFDLSQLRLMGVMQRLGICYGITALLAVTIPHKRFMPLAIILLVVYFIFQLFGNGFEKSVDNIVGMIDSAILGANHMYLQGRQFVDLIFQQKLVLAAAVQQGGFRALSKLSAAFVCPTAGHLLQGGAAGFIELHAVAQLLTGCDQLLLPLAGAQLAELFLDDAGHDEDGVFGVGQRIA